MKVCELISILEKMPQDSMCVRSGYEAGLEEIKEVYTEKIKLNVNKEWYYGPHVPVDKDEDCIAVYID